MALYVHPIGAEAKDLVTGVTGILDNVAFYLHGCPRYCLQPKAKEDGSIPDSLMVDEPQLEILNGKPIIDVPEHPPARFAMGQVVHDPITDIKGTVVGRSLYLNGCCRVLVAPKHDPNAHNPSGIAWVDEPQLEPVKGLMRDKHTVKPETPIRQTGGPVPLSSKR